MSYAEVSVNSPAGRRQLFSYSIPPELDICPGQAVWVPFGNYTLQGIVVSISQFPAVQAVRPIDGIIENTPVIPPASLKLAQWISSYYLCPLFSALSCFLPPGFERQPLTFLSATDKVLPDDVALSERARQTLKLLRQTPEISLKQLEKTLGKKASQKAVGQLVERGLAQRYYRMQKEKIKPRLENYLRLNEQADIGIVIAQLQKRRAVKQAELINYLKQQSAAVPLSNVLEAGFSRALIKQLTMQNLASPEKISVEREPIDYTHVRCDKALTLNEAQQAALTAICAGLQSGRAGVFVLHGVTGSGKTEVYLQALAQAVKLGKKGLVLVPEIALTPQTIERFAARFPHHVAVLHSHLSLGEQFDQWHSISRGDFDVVVGARSAIFAPQPQLGLIVIDEEHEWTYKQQEQLPYYHTRNVAIKLAELTGATMVLGSATPDVETYYNTQNGSHTLLKLPQRIKLKGDATALSIELVDLREELKGGNLSIFSRSLHEGITEALARREQVILFFNRRGSASFVQCHTCSFVVQCRRCQVPMSYHSAEESLICHHCNYHTAVPTICPRCHSRRIKFVGIGTQKLEEETSREFPQARLLRWDSDVTRSRHAHEMLMHKMKTRQVDILIGTQMVAKGLDLPHVTLVGVISADTSINLPDFRAGERAFQLLTQVAGRAGRGEKAGKVIIQTYSPEHYAVQAVLQQSYTSFYKQEIKQRQNLNAPPFSKMVRLTYVHTNEKAAQNEAERLKRQLTALMSYAGIVDVQISGPAPAFIARLRGRYRYQMTLRGNQPARLLEKGELPAGWSVDVDPLGLN